MTTRDAYLEKLKSQLDEWGKDIDRLDRETSKADAKAKIKYEEQINELRQNVEEAQQTLTTIRDANENTWEDLKQGAETIWDLYKNSFKKAKSEFKRGYKEGLEE